jgi:hypothetical protein
MDPGQLIPICELVPESSHNPADNILSRIFLLLYFYRLLLLQHVEYT